MTSLAWALWPPLSFSNFAIDPIPKVDDFSRIITTVAAQESDLRSFLCVLFLPQNG
jgi:hypothetical protein